MTALTSSTEYVTLALPTALAVRIVSTAILAKIIRSLPAKIAQLMVACGAAWMLSVSVWEYRYNFSHLPFFSSHVLPKILSALVITLAPMCFPTLSMMHSPGSTTKLMSKKCGNQGLVSFANC